MDKKSEYKKPKLKIHGNIKTITKGELVAGQCRERNTKHAMFLVVFLKYDPIILLL